jgi:hypothetical protein
MAKQKINTDSSSEFTHYIRDKCDTFTITEDKLKLKLINLKKSIESKTSIFCYIGIIITIGIALISSNFKDFIFNKNLWQAIFIICLVFFIVLLIKDVILFSKNKKDINDVIEDIKKEQK